MGGWSYVSYVSFGSYGSYVSYGSFGSYGSYGAGDCPLSSLQFNGIGQLQPEEKPPST